MIKIVTSTQLLQLAFLTLTLFVHSNVISNLNLKIYKEETDFWPSLPHGLIGSRENGLSIIKKETGFPDIVYGGINNGYIVITQYSDHDACSVTKKISTIRLGSCIKESSSQSYVFSDYFPVSGQEMSYFFIRYFSDGYCEKMSQSSIFWIQPGCLNRESVVYSLAIPAVSISGLMTT